MEKSEKVLYRTMEKTGDELSILGYGCMRFPRKNGAIDEDRTERQILSAIDRGVNYFDTAYIYPGSEKVLGKILAKGYRDRVKIATKLPIFMIHGKNDMEKIFNKQLENLRTDHIDYYLMHNISSFEEWETLKQMGIVSFIQQEQEKGRIIHIGFSFHGNVLAFKKIVDDYEWDFCQIQYNYLDEHYQAGTEGLEYAAAKGLGIVVMEPLRGGMLVDKMPPSAKKMIENFQPQKSAAEWALRWVWNHPEVNVLLSGMNAEEHIDEDIHIAADAYPEALTEQALEMLDTVKNEFHSKIKVPCTGCAYCMPCPHGVDIPLSFAAYNDTSMFGGVSSKMMYLMATVGVSAASQCKDCGLCEKHCPQQIPIRRQLKEVSSTMEKAYLTIPVRIARAFMGRGKKRTTRNFQA